jgi:hypothetical protein
VSINVPMVFHSASTLRSSALRRSVSRDTTDGRSATRPDGRFG